MAREFIGKEAEKEHLSASAACLVSQPLNLHTPLEEANGKWFGLKNGHGVTHIWGPFGFGCIGIDLVEMSKVMRLLKRVRHLLADFSRFGTGMLLCHELISTTLLGGQQLETNVIQYRCVA
ncbi:Uncharacterized protein Fot_48702 [Forsythia ovata]|uniref:Uncharacterized protein n=1 Tax=Forsythia ovata TaxID=205694 RepID=A0ABD1Q9Z9_9LAMI